MKSAPNWAWYVIRAMLSVGCSFYLQSMMRPVAQEPERRINVKMAGGGFSASARDAAFIAFALHVLLLSSYFIQLN